jgi:leukotriene-A4 hydrolase
LGDGGYVRLQHAFSKDHGDLSAKFGRGLHITLKIRIQYATTPTADAIQWLEPQQTEGKKYPYLFTQCQAIHCRTLVPIQDTPGNKVYHHDITITSHHILIPVHDY